MFTANSSAAKAAHEKWLQLNKDPSRRCHSIQELSTTLTTHQKNKRVWMDSGVHFEHLWKQGVCHISRHLFDTEMLYVATDYSKEIYGFSYTPWERNFLSTQFNLSNPAGLDLLEFLEAEDTLKLNEFLEWASKEKNKGEKRKRDPPQTEKEPHKKVCEEDLISWSSSKESRYVSEDSFLFV